MTVLDPSAPLLLVRRDLRMLARQLTDAATIAWCCDDLALMQADERAPGLSRDLDRLHQLLTEAAALADRTAGRCW